ncbi:MAG: PhnB protein [Variibacter sp.]|jgi:PhnB protein|nr:PhnB protein [Variibacter sp.]
MPQTITPYLTVRGAAAAIEFYKAAFGARETGRHPAGDGQRVLHASLFIRDGAFFLSDEFPEHSGTPAPTPEKPTSVSIAIGLASPAEVDAMFRQAVAAGANGWMEPADMFWGERFAMLDDPFGHRWMLSAPLRKDA